MTKKIISWDLETFLINTDYPEPYGFQGLAPLPVCMSYQEAGRRAQITNSYDQMCTLCNEWVADDNVILIAQNAPFEMFECVSHLGVPIEQVFDKFNKGLIKDTYVRETLFRLANGDAVKHPNWYHDLGSMVNRYLDIDISASKGEDAWRMRYSELYGVPMREWPQEAIDYSLMDSVYTLKVFAKQHKHRALFQANETAQTRASFDLHLLSSTCPRVDDKAVQKFIDEHSEQVAAAQAPLIRKGILKPNPNRYKTYPKGDPRREGYSMDQKLLKRLVQADYTKQGKVVPGTPTGDISLAGDTLCGCSNKILRRYGEAATDIKLMSGFAPALLQALEHPKQQATTRYSVILKTGRTGSSKMNLQNLPKAPGARECFIPPEGHVVACIDYNSMEMVCAAQTMYTLYGIHRLLDALNEGKDPHVMVAATFMGEEYETTLEQYAEKDELVGKYRQLAKIFNFGAFGGMGAATMLSNMDEPTVKVMQELYPGQNLESVVKQLIKDWKDQWELNSHFNKLGRLCQGGKKPTYTCPTTGRIKALNTYCQLANIHFQGIAADCLKTSLGIIQESAWIPGRYLHSKQVQAMVEVHDEIVFSGPVEGLAEWTRCCADMMQEGAQKLLPDCVVRTEIEITGDRWRKKGWTVEDYLDKIDA